MVVGAARLGRWSVGGGGNFTGCGGRGRLAATSSGPCRSVRRCEPPRLCGLLRNNSPALTHRWRRRWRRRRARTPSPCLSSVGNLRGARSVWRRLSAAPPRLQRVLPPLSSFSLGAATRTGPKWSSSSRPGLPPSGGERSTLLLPPPHTPEQEPPPARCVWVLSGFSAAAGGSVLVRFFAMLQRRGRSRIGPPLSPPLLLN